MAACAGEIELAAPRVEIFLAVLIGRQCARIVRDLDVEWFAARGERHIGGQRRHLVLDVGVRLFAVGLAATVERKLERDDFAAIGVEIRVVLADADALVLEAVAVGLAVLERGGEHLLAAIDGKIVGREVVDRLPLLAQVGVHRIRPVDEIVQRHVRKFLGEVVAKRLELGGRIHGVGRGSRPRADGEQDRDHNWNCAQHPFFSGWPIQLQHFGDE